ncbi:hypothetical protein WJR50_20570 [Catalinimonas sp. 4WD22]|uniref:hypothetical protein n=1 Tax=Catalinimonas locisalis TaxID=3133978 RepID=UPI003100DC6D
MSRIKLLNLILSVFFFSLITSCELFEDEQEDDISNDIIKDTPKDNTYGKGSYTNPEEELSPLLHPELLTGKCYLFDYDSTKANGSADQVIDIKITVFEDSRFERKEIEYKFEEEDSTIINMITFTYDDQNRLYIDSTFYVFRDKISLSYHSEYIYDQDNVLIREIETEDPDSSSPDITTFDYAYDANGNMIEKKGVSDTFFGNGYWNETWEYNDQNLETYHSLESNPPGFSDNYSSREQVYDEDGYLVFFCREYKLYNTIHTTTDKFYLDKSQLPDQLTIIGKWGGCVYEDSLFQRKYSGGRLETGKELRFFNANGKIDKRESYSYVPIGSKFELESITTYTYDNKDNLIEEETEWFEDDGQSSYILRHYKYTFDDTNRLINSVYLFRGEISSIKEYTYICS